MPITDLKAFQEINLSKLFMIINSCLSLKYIYLQKIEENKKGALLSIIFCDNFADCIMESQFLVCADDSVIYASGKAVEAIEKFLTNDLNYIAEYFNEKIINNQLE